MMALTASMVALAHASPAPDRSLNSAEILHALQSLSSTARVLYVAAHPDDENTRLLAHLTEGEHVQAAYLSLTRGGGGQNRIGDEQAGLLSVLRTQELVSARRIDGARQFFTRARDFGYSKSAEETLSVWDEEQVLADMVRVYRSFRPDVVITRFREGSRTHGHHLASAELARKAMSLSADPDHPSPLPPHAPLRLVLNVPTWSDEPQRPGQVELEVGGYSALLGRTHAETAARSRSRHRSQAFGSAPDRGRVVERFEWVAGQEMKAHPLDGVDRTWTRFDGGKRVDRALQRIIEGFDVRRPHRSVSAMAQLDGLLEGLGDAPRVREARVRLAELTAAAAGLHLRVAGAMDQVHPGRVEAEVQAEVRGPDRVTLDAVSVEDTEQRIALGWGLEPREPRTGPIRFQARRLGPAPWLREPVDGGMYRVPEDADPNAPDGGGPVRLKVTARFAGRALSWYVPWAHYWVDRSQGELAAPVFVVPSVTATPLSRVLYPTGDSVQVSFRVDGDPERLRLIEAVPQGVKVEGPARQGATVTYTLRLPPTVPPFDVTPRVREARGSAAGGAPAPGSGPALSKEVIDHPHVMRQVVLTPATVRIVPMPKAPALSVGYVMGAGDRVPEALAALGFRVRLLSDEDLARRRYQGLDVIVTGVRAFNVREQLADAGLFDWVADGGHLVVQYNTNSWYSKLEVPVGPKPLEIGRGRVTDENAAVRRLQPRHPVFDTPLPIRDEDFEDWVQERGLYFAETWDPGYQPLLAMRDAGDSEERGSLLVGTHGRGTFVYTGLSFFRQLPAGVQGAARLWVNLIAHPFGGRS